MKRLLTYSARLSYEEPPGHVHEDSFPVVASTPQEATKLAFAYVLQVLKLGDFELRVLGA
ncbi:MAG TPA: hypothetical protein VFE33_04975 [Thermoanaerobaculia bacterium]|nr:hypothetical protein [Thermoanaerobaculia bacterium]